MRRSFALAGLLLVAACEPRPATPARLIRVLGTVQGAASKVTILVPEKSWKVETTPSGGRYALDVDAEQVAGARVVVESASGAAVTSGKLDAVASVTTAILVQPLRVWSARVEIKREGDRLRFSWPPLDGLAAERLRYSLTFAYTNTKGEISEGTVMSAKEPETVQTLAGLAPIFPDRDLSVKSVEIRPRAYDAADVNGPMWTGEPLAWTLPDDLPATTSKGGE